MAKNNEYSPLEYEILATLSFMEPMSLEHLFLDLDPDFAKNNPELSYEDLLKTLSALKKRKLIKQTELEGQKAWIKVYPKRAWYKRLVWWF